jgi:hypothetical protein
MAQVIVNELNIPEVEIIKLAKEGYLFPMKTPVLNSHFF